MATVNTVDDADQIDLATLDLTDPEHFTEGPPHALFRRLRREAPVHWNDTTHGPRFWSLTRAADIVTVSKNSKTFVSSGGVFFRDDAPVPLEMARRLMLSMDAPEHTKYRKIVQKVFTPNAIAHQEDSVRAKVSMLVDSVCEAGRCDLVNDFALHLPLSVIGTMMGVPPADLPELTSAFLRVERGTMEPGPDTLIAVGEIAGYLSELVAARHRNPEPDLITALIQAEVDGESLQDVETMLFFTLLMMAGADTTRNALAGGMLALMAHPEQRALIATDPDRYLPGVVEEILRWVTPIMYFRRTATTDTEVNGTPIAEGDRLVMWYASGSRDESVHTDPDRFDITRTRVDHQAFGGGGRHFCLGASLARMELRIAIGELLRRLPDAQPDGPPRRNKATWTNNLAAVPITFTPTARAD